LISGAGGGVGALTVQYAHAMGFRVIAIDAGHAKREFCLNLRADAYIDVLEEEDPSAAVKKLTLGRGASIVLVTAGAGVAYQQGLESNSAVWDLGLCGRTASDPAGEFPPSSFCRKRDQDHWLRSGHKR
jgi:D-arabinose 1-dehydrogenase-like Zn-dependent alcohol dehydrogenase